MTYEFGLDHFLEKVNKWSPKCHRLIPTKTNKRTNQTHTLIAHTAIMVALGSRLVSYSCAWFVPLDSFSNRCTHTHTLTERERHVLTIKRFNRIFIPCLKQIGVTFIMDYTNYIQFFSIHLISHHILSLVCVCVYWDCCMRATESSIVLLRLYGYCCCRCCGYYCYIPIPSFPFISFF